MFNFEIRPQARPSDIYYNFFITSNSEDSFSIRYIYFSLPDSLYQLENMLDRLIELYQKTFKINCLTFENEQIQYLIFKQLIQVKASKKDLIMTHIKPELFKLAKYEAEFLQYRIQQQRPLNAVGSIWYASESRWPYIGYLPQTQTILLTFPTGNLYLYPDIKPHQGHLLDQTTNAPLPLEDFAECLRRFLEQFTGPELIALCSRILNKLKSLARLV